MGSLWDREMLNTNYWTIDTNSGEGGVGWGGGGMGEGVKVQKIYLIGDPQNKMQTLYASAGDYLYWV